MFCAVEFGFIFVQMKRHGVFDASFEQEIFHRDDHFIIEKTR